MSEFSKEFGKALYLLAEEESETLDILNELEIIDSVINKNREYINLMDTPAILQEKKVSLIDDAFSGCSLYVRNFLKILSKKKCFYKLSDCVKEYKKLYDKNNNIERVKVITCVPLREDQILRLKEKIEQKIKKEAIINNQVDKSILGGAVVEFSDWQYDSSLRTKLDNLSDLIKGSIF
ncbi:MAG: ATP synthase F1 subunit delta [Ruminococcaceae bacterium]|nr:ATP synthase F1 subunit delta [Oscillospiraceae bacterium]